MAIETSVVHQAVQTKLKELEDSHKFHTKEVCDAERRVESAEISVIYWHKQLRKVEIQIEECKAYLAENEP